MKAGSGESVWWCLLTPLHHGQGQKNIDNGDNIPTTKTTFRGTPVGTYIHLTILLTKVSKKRIIKIRKDRVQYIAIQKKKKMVFYECVVTARNTASKSSQPTLRFSNNINITVPSSLSL